MAQPMRGAKVKPLGAAAGVGVRDERGCPDLRTWGQVLEVENGSSQISKFVFKLFRVYIFIMYIYIVYI